MKGYEAEENAKNVTGQLRPAGLVSSIEAYSLENRVLFTLKERFGCQLWPVVLVGMYAQNGSSAM